MKKSLLIILSFFFVGSLAFAQSPKMTAKGDHVSVTYGAPSVKNREIFGGLVPYNEVWRTGANNATEITFDKDGTFGGVAVKKGTYTLFTIPQKSGDWTVILNPTLGQWGAYGYKDIKDKDLPHTKATVTMTSSVTEQMEIKVEGSNLVIGWDKVKATVPMSF